MKNKTTSKIIGRKLSKPINSFELRDIKKDFCKVNSIFFHLKLIVKLSLATKILGTLAHSKIYLCKTFGLTIGGQ